MDLNEEISQTAHKLNGMVEKAKKSASQEKLIKTLFLLGPTGIAKSLVSLTKEEKLIMNDALEVMEKGMKEDENYSAKYVQGKMTERVIQEDKVDDDADEKLVKPENSNVNPQGDQSDPSREENKVEDPKKVEKGSSSSTEMHDLPDMEKAVSDMHEKGMSRGQAEGYGMAKGYDGEDYKKAMDEKYGDSEMKKGDGVKNPEETQVKDELEKLTSKPVRADSSRPKELELEEDNKKAQNKVDDLKQGMKKSVNWNPENELLKSNTLGRNFHFSMEDHYTEAVNTVMGIGTKEKIEKSSSLSLNDLIEKGEDLSWDEVLTKSALIKNEEQELGNATLVKSFDISDVAHSMSITKEDLDKVLKD